MIIAVDFDGTCVTHMYPNVGENIGAEHVLRALTEEGHEIVLNTMRSGQELRDAENWFKEYNVPLFGVNKTPGQNTWTTSPKVYANLYIDDAALGCPVKSHWTRPFVDWEAVATMLVHKGILSSDSFRTIIQPVIDAKNGR